MTLTQQSVEQANLLAQVLSFADFSVLFGGIAVCGLAVIAKAVVFVITKPMPHAERKG